MSATGGNGAAPTKGWEEARKGWDEMLQRLSESSRNRRPEYAPPTMTFSSLDCSLLSADTIAAIANDLSRCRGSTAEAQTGLDNTIDEIERYLKERHRHSARRR